MIHVRLEWYELQQAASVAEARHVKSILDGRKPAYGAKEEGSLEMHYQGAYAEIAAAKALGRYWPGSVDTFSREDIPPNIQVRATKNSSNRLIIRPSDNPKHAYVLVSGNAPNFTLHGWMFGEHAQNNEWVDAPGGRPGAWFVPQSALYPIDALKAIFDYAALRAAVKETVGNAA